MSPPYFILSQQDSFPRDDSEDSESAPMIHDIEKTSSSHLANRSRLVNIYHWIGHGLSCLALLGLLFRGSWERYQQLSKTDKRVQTYTPADGALGDLSHTTIFQNSFWEKSPYKGPPTPEVLAKWDHLTRTGPVNITASEMTKLGHSLDAVQYPPEMGGGYLAYLESAHQLHCLQALWEDHHFQKYPHMFPGLAEKLRTQPNITEYHYEHCVDVIRNRLMCTADSQLVTFRWVESVSGPYPYFNTKHTCNNYEALLAWDKERWADKEALDGYGWNPPADTVRLKKAP